MAEVVLSNVGKVYPGNVRAVKDFNLQIADGEFVVLVGPSGCGKSTTLRMVAGLEDITEGTVTIDERVVNEVHPKDRDIAMVFQNYALYPHMTVYKNMAFALKLRKTPKAEIERRVNEAATILGIDTLLDRKPKALSGGQRQRVALGRAIVREPKAFLFDEPLSNLDAKLRVETRAELKSLHMRLKTTTIYVTHDQEEAMTLGDRVVIMSDGLVQQIGPPLEVYQRPANRFVAGFLGMPPMNFLDGAIDASTGVVQFVENASEPIRVPVPSSIAEAVRGRDGQSVVLGIRPEGIGASSSSSSASANQIDLEVEVVEPLGDRIDLYLKTRSQQRIVARVDANDVSVRPGQTTQLTIDAERMHLFEPGPFGVRIGD